MRSLITEALRANLKRQFTDEPYASYGDELEYSMPEPVPTMSPRLKALVGKLMEVQNNNDLMSAVEAMVRAASGAQIPGSTGKNRDESHIPRPVPGVRVDIDDLPRTKPEGETKNKGHG